MPHSIFECIMNGRVESPLCTCSNMCCWQSGAERMQEDGSNHCGSWIWNDFAIRIKKSLNCNHVSDLCLCSSRIVVPTGYDPETAAFFMPDLCARIRPRLKRLPRVLCFWCALSVPFLWADRAIWYSRHMMPGWFQVWLGKSRRTVTRT